MGSETRGRGDRPKRRKRARPGDVLKVSTPQGGSQPGVEAGGTAVAALVPHCSSGGGNAREASGGGGGGHTRGRVATSSGEPASVRSEGKTRTPLASCA